MDYSENLSQQYKFEPQFCYFNWSQYSLHCTIKHTDCDISPNKYVYHLSDEMNHYFAFTSTFVRHLLRVDKPSIILFKSDNCATQYKTIHI